MGDIRLKHDGWVVVADGEKALFLRNEGDEKYPNLQVFSEMEQENPATRDQGSNRPGRLNDATSGQKSAVQETDWHRIGKERFAGEIADLLYKQAHAGRFEQIVLVAPPLVLGELRRELHESVTSRLAGEVDKTLTGHPVHKIEEIVLASDA